MVADSEDFYAISIGELDDPGVLVRIPRAGGPATEIPIQPAAIAAGFNSSRSFCPWHILLLGDDIIVTTKPDNVAVDFEVLCFDKATLGLKWLWASEDSRDLRWYTVPVEWNGHLVFASVEYGVATYITFLDRATGEERYERTIPENSLNTIIEPLVHDGKLYIRTTGHPLAIYDLSLALDPGIPDDQTCVFSVSSQCLYGDPNNNAITAFEDRYFVTCDRNLQARTLVSNELLWQNPLANSNYWVGAPFTLHDGSLFVPADYGYVYRIDAESGSTQWVKDIRPKDVSVVNLYAQGFIVQDRWYVQPAYSSSELVVLSLDDGSIVARIPCWVSLSNRIGFVEGGDIYMTTDFEIIKVHLREK